MFSSLSLDFSWASAVLLIVIFLTGTSQICNLLYYEAGTNSMPSNSGVIR